jgi:hypothetical protein
MWANPVGYAVAARHFSQGQHVTNGTSLGAFALSEGCDHASIFCHYTTLHMI